MIEVRISMVDLVEFRTQGSVTQFTLEKLIGAGVPIDPESAEFRLLREGRLEHVGVDIVSDHQVWRWYEIHELPPYGTVQ